MGQKTNVLTLRKRKSQLNLLSNSSKAFLYGFQFLKNFEKLLSRKGILVLEKTLNFYNNQAFLTLTTFFRSNKTIFYRRKKLSKKSSINLISLNSNFLNLFSAQFNLFSNNLLVLNFKNINKQLNKRLCAYFYETIKRFNGVLFSRRFNLFIDFIKFSSFFAQSKINSNSYIYLLGQIFRILPKRKHTRFIFFLKTIFKIIVEKAPYYFEKQSNILKIKGIKFTINGKLQGKTRADSSSIQVGSVPIQSIGKNVDFSKLHVYTIYGAFGFQMWVYRN
jgi:hypothetical protein